MIRQPRGSTPARAEVIEERRSYVAGRRVEVILVAEGDRAGSVAAEQPERAVDLVELVEVQRRVEHAVLQPVRERASPAVAHDTLEQVRSHAARSSAGAPATSVAAANPDRQPSSWNP